MSVLRAWRGQCFGSALGPWIIFYVVLLATSCQSQEDERRPQALTVGATWGITSFEPDDSLSGSTATAIDLLFDSVADHIASAQAQGRVVRFTLREDTPYTSEILADSFSYSTLVSSRVVDSRHIETTFADEDAALKVATLSYGSFALGPFVLAQQTKTTARLQRKSKQAFQEIILQEVTAQDEWRLFLSRKLNVIPHASILYRKELAQLPSVKLIDYPPSHDVALFFNTNRPALRAANSRRYLASQIDRTALSRALFGTPEQSLPQPKPTAEVPTFDLPLRIAYLKDSFQLKRTAEILQFQLAEYNILLQLHPLPIAELIQYCLSDAYDLALFPVPMGKDRYDRFLSPSHPASINFTSFASPLYDRAYAANDEAQLKAILSEELPVSFLYRQLYFAAMDASLCNDKQPKMGSWHWLASIHPCESDTP